MIRNVCLVNLIKHQLVRHKNICLEEVYCVMNLPSMLPQKPKPYNHSIYLSCYVWQYVQQYVYALCCEQLSFIILLLSLKYKGFYIFFFFAFDLFQRMYPQQIKAYQNTVQPMLISLIRNTDIYRHSCAVIFSIYPPS